MSVPTDMPRRRQTHRRADEIYARIRQEIVEGGLRPNQRIVEIELANWLEVSRTPVREALLRLEVDGLVESDHRGWAVHEHTAQEIEHIFQCRIALDSYAARLAALGRTEEQLKEIQRAYMAGLAIDPERVDDRVCANDRFHELVIEAGDNPLMTSLIDRSRLYHFNHRVAVGYSREEWEKSHEEHGALVDAIARHDADGAEALARAHLAAAMEKTLAQLEGRKTDRRGLLRN